MTRLILTKCLSLIVSLLAASLIIFFVVEIIPGDPAAFMLGLNASPETITALQQQLGLNGDPLTRYFEWVLGMLRGDFGTSYTYRVPVAELVLDRLEVSLPLALYALVLTALIAFPVGMLAAVWRGRVADYGIMGLTQLGIAVPNFWFAMILVLIFAVGLGWFSAGGFTGWDQGILSGLKSLTLPAIALAVTQASILARIMRSSLIETLGQDYIRTARAKGLSERTTLIRHALRNALIPVMTIIGLQFSFLLAGAIIIENVFFLPGLGRLIFQGITQRDLIVVESVVMILVFAVILVNFLVDVAYAAIDPRLRTR
ncbi:MAG: ABC transporter permease [Rhodobacteraceae bacterium]|nr:ABC transporter permease [Paracoccaceae bacterium]